MKSASAATSASWATAQGGGAPVRNRRAHGERFDHPDRFVTSPADAQRAVDIAKGFAAKKAEGAATAAAAGAVINGLIIRGEDQVMLKVTVAEVSRTVLKQLGVSTNPASGAETLLSGGWGTLTNNNPFAINPTLSNATVTAKGPGGTSATLQAFERYSVARILAEPTVTAVSGEVAKMMVGGEIAVPGPGRLHDLDIDRRQSLHAQHRLQAIWRLAGLYAGGAVGRTHSHPRRHRSDGSRSHDHLFLPGRLGAGLQDAQERNDGRAAFRRIHRHRRA